MKAIFLDRDGTINADVNYLCSKSDIKIIDGAIEALKVFKDMGFLNIIVTNQSAVARGMITLEQLQEIHKEFYLQLKSGDIHLIDDIFYSPYHQDGIIEEFSILHPDTKPGTGMLLKAQKKFSLDFRECYIVGDKSRDIETGNNAGVKSILVGKESLEECKKKKLVIEYVAIDLLEASKYIAGKNL